MELDIVKNITTWNDASSSINSNFAKLSQAIDELEEGGGGTDIDLSDYAKKGDVDKLEERVSKNEQDIADLKENGGGSSTVELQEWYQRVGKKIGWDEDGLHTDENFRSSKEISAGGVGEEADTSVSGTVTAVKVDDGEPIYPDNDGVVDISGALEGVVNELDLEKYAKKDDLDALEERVTRTEEKNIEQDNSLNTIKSIEKWYNEVGSHIHKDEHGVYTTENFRSFGEISAGGVGTESEGGGGEGSTTLDGLMDVEIEDKNLDDFQSNSQVIGYDRQTGIWVNKVTMYKHPQSKAESEWNITHNLGKMPNVKVIDSTGALVHGTVVYDPTDLLNKLTISFGGAFSGTAYLD